MCRDSATFLIWENCPGILCWKSSIFLWDPTHRLDPLLQERGGDSLGPFVRQKRHHDVPAEPVHQKLAFKIYNCRNDQLTLILCNIWQFFFGRSCYFYSGVLPNAHKSYWEVNFPANVGPFRIWWVKEEPLEDPSTELHVQFLVVVDCTAVKVEVAMEQDLC